MTEILNLTKTELTRETITMGTLFEMSKLIIAYENFLDFQGLYPHTILMTKKQYDAYDEQLKIVGEMLGLDINKKLPFLTFRGVKIKVE